MEWMNNVFDALENDTDIKGIVFVSSFNFNGNGNGHTWKEFPKERLHIADRLSYL
jgi:adenine specific DNA methylase Mod